MNRVDGENWLRLHLAARESVRMRSIVNSLGGASETMDYDPDALYSSGKADAASKSKLIRAHSAEITEKVNETVELCRKNGWRIITPQSPLYPKALTELKRYPFVLYAAGDAGLLTGCTGFSIVGTRSATQKARTVAFKLAYGLSQSGVAVISGGALGLDAASHEGALCGKTGTAAVLGSGLGSTYLRKNEELRRRISRHGVLITELDPFEAPSKYTFPERNKIIAALGGACCVVESGIEGGSMITASRATEYRRPICVPSAKIISSEGCVRLHEQGAAEIEAVGDALKLLTENGFAVPDMSFSEKGLAPDYDVDFTIPGFKQFFFDTGRQKNDTLSDGENKKTTKKKTSGNLSGGRKDKLSGISGHGSAPGNAAGKAPEEFGSASSGAATDKATGNLPGGDTGTTFPGNALFDTAELTPEENAVLSVLSVAPTALDKIVELTGLSAGNAASALTLLELRGMVSSYYGNMYSLPGGTK